MNIWLIKIGEALPFEVNEKRGRTWLMAEAFAKKNDFVIWWAGTFNHFLKEKYKTSENIIRIKDNFLIYLLPSIGYKKNVSFMRYMDHLFISKLFKYRSSKYKKPDIIIASSPWHHLAYEAIIYAKKNKIKVILDIRDPWPDAFLNYVPKGFKKFVKLFLFYDFYTFKYSAKNADAITAVSYSMLDMGLKYGERAKTKNDLVFYNGFEIPEKKIHIDLKNSSLKIIESLKGNFLVLYIGGFSELHDPSIVLDVARSLADLKVHFLLAGRGEKYQEIEIRSKKMHNVHLLGWLNNDEIATLVSLGHIGLAPTIFNSEVLPNKAIMYLAGGLPVISAFQGDLRHLISKYEAGINYAPGDSKTVKNTICNLYKNEYLYNQMKKNALKVYNMHFKPGLIFENYYQFVKNFIS